MIEAWIALCFSFRFSLPLSLSLSHPLKWNLVDQIETHCNIYWSFAWTGSIEHTRLNEQLGDHQNLKNLQAHFCVWLCLELWKGLRQFGKISGEFTEAQFTCPEEKYQFLFSTCFTLKVSQWFVSIRATPSSSYISFQSNKLGTFLL